MNLAGKTAVVTGSSSGVGLATTRLLLSLGAKVIGLDRSPCTLDAPGFRSFNCDLSSKESIKNAVAECAKLFNSKVDILANVAGVMDGFSSADSVLDDVWSRTLDINVTGPTMLIRGILPFMRQNGTGSIINVGSRASTSGAAGVAYTASKHAMIGVTKNVAWRFHEEGIRCNAVCPGSMATNIQQSIPSDSFDHEAYGVSSGLFPCICR
ncbi:hypothetical protein CEP51_005009 [Fusarium floridanum]|uniref:Uncharacterized protein n=1 Tax=Fusarium floridanum TaxID=1325733 RepID=A0A428RYT4_9HYPO|nr:hypothetical protein CEP51_005009 [Fusarium floridanum]